MLNFARYPKREYNVARMAKKKIPDFEFIKDEPLSAKSASFYNFYHASFTPALKKILSIDGTPHTIGIFGSWGAGKSTIIQMLEDDEDLDIPIFVFDAWKYQDDALRRTFLIKFVNFLEKKTDTEIDASILNDLYAAKTLTQPLIVAPNKKLPFWKSARKFINDNGLLILTGLLVAAWATLMLGFSQSGLVKRLTALSSQMASIALIAFVADKVFTSFLSELTKKILKKSEEKEKVLSTIHKERLNSPEEFEEKFKSILKKVEGKVIVVFDNIDRVQGDVAVAMMSTIKTYMEPNNKSQIIFIIPCDPEAIEAQITKLYESTNGPKTTASDYLRKVFNLILWLPDYIPSDLEEYTLQKLKKTGKIAHILATNDVALVINAAYSRNPREIVQFINNLVATVLTVQQSKVADLILANVPYLAKVQVLKQKYPSAYKRLQQRWNTPEEIYDDKDEDADSLREFLRLTSRMTVDDVEPFIFFKNPLETRNLQKSSEFVIALGNGDTEYLAQLIDQEPKKDAAVNFTIDLMSKYRSIPPTLLNIYNTQFHGIYQVVPDELRKRYYGFLADMVDTHLWAEYEQLDIDHTFLLIKESNLSIRQRDVLIKRYVGEIRTATGSKSYNVAFLEKLLDNITTIIPLLSKTQIQSVRTAHEKSDLVRNVALPRYADAKVQKELVSEAALLSYFKTIDEGVAERVSTIVQYKTYIIEGSVFIDLIDAFVNAFLTRYNTSPTDFAALSAYSDAVNDLAKTFGDELDSEGIKPSLTQLSNILTNCSNNFTEAQKENEFLISLRWLTRYMEASVRQATTNHIGSLLTSFPPKDFAQFFDYWEFDTKNRFLNDYEDFIYRRVLSESEILRYVYDVSHEENKVKLMQYVVSNTPPGQSYDADFLNSIDTSSIKNVIIELLIERSQSMNVAKSGFTQYILNNMKKNSPKTLREKVIEYIKFMVNQENASNVQAGVELLNKEAFLYDSDKNPLANSLIEYVNNRGALVSSTQIELIKTMIVLFPNSKGALNKTVFSQLPNAVDGHMIDAMYSILAAQKVNFKANKSDMIELRDRILILPERVKQVHLHDILSLRGGKETKEEKAFWESLSS